MNPMLKEAFTAEMAAAATAMADNDLNEAFRCYERAHILGQRHTWAHIKSHVGMLRVGVRRRDGREVRGQVLRIVAASIFSRIWIPVGNTGGANVSATKPMPIPEDLMRYLL